MFLIDVLKANPIGLKYTLTSLELSFWLLNVVQLQECLKYCCRVRKLVLRSEDFSAICSDEVIQYAALNCPLLERCQIENHRGSAEQPLQN